MDKIRVYLQYPWKYSECSYYKYMISNVPKVDYVNIQEKSVSKKKFILSNGIKKIIRSVFNIFNLSLVNQHKTRDGDYDLIHCAHCLSSNKNKPWVCDMECEFQFYVGKKNKRVKNKVQKILERENCKKIFTWTEETYNDIVKEYPTIKDKVSLVYPIVPSLIVNRKKHHGIILFYAGRYFYAKGGLDTLEVMDRLTKKYDDVSAIFVSLIPNEIREKYSKNKKIKIYDLMPQKELFENVYSVGDIFIYPGYSDSFGFAIPEAMSLGAPVISTDLSTRREIITHNKNGFLVNCKGERYSLIKKSENNELNEDVIEQMCKYTSQLIENKVLYKNFSKNAKNEIVNGKFSAINRGKDIFDIYCNAIK